MAREEIIAAPLELWLAPVGEAFPTVGTTPTGNWELLGKSGDENYTDDGVSVELSQTTETFTPVGGTMPAKAWRTDEGVMFTVTVADIRHEVLKVALNDNDVTETTGETSIPLLRGLDVTEYALVAVGKSPYEADGDGQFQVPRCFMSGDGIELVYQKGEPVGAEMTFTALDPGDSESDFALIYTDASIS